MTRALSSDDVKESRRKMWLLVFTTTLAILLGVFEELADPFGLDTQSDRLSANIFNSITSPLYGEESRVKIDGVTYDSRFDQSNIVVLLLDDSYLESVGVNWPLEPRRYQRILRKLVDAGASAIFIDIFFSQNTVERQQSIAWLYREASCLAEASACPVVDDDWSCRDLAEAPCAKPLTDAGTAIIFAGTKQTPVPMAGETAPPASALGQMLSRENIYNLHEPGIDGEEYDTAGWALYKAWCQRDARCDSAALNNFPQEAMYLHWGYAPNRMMTDISDFGGGACVPQSRTLIGRLWQSVTVFGWNFIRGFHDARIAPCPYHSQLKLQLFNNLSPDELRQLFANKVVLFGASLKNYPDYQWSPVHDYIPGVFWHAMAVDNLMEFSASYMKDANEPASNYLEPFGISVIFILQALLSWKIQRREELENPAEFNKIKLDLLHGLLMICVISAAVLWITGFNRWSPANWIGLAMLMFLIDSRPVTAVPRFCWSILPRARLTRRPFRLISNLVVAMVLMSIMLLGAYTLFILPHALMLGREMDDTIISVTFLIVYLGIILFCGWKIFWGKPLCE